MSKRISSSAVVFASACLALATTGYGQPRGSQPQQTNSTHNFYITTPQTGEQQTVGSNSAAVSTSANSQVALNTYTATATWQRPSASSSDSTQASPARTASSGATNTSRQQQQRAQANANYYTQQATAYNTYNNYYHNHSVHQHTAQQTVYPAYVAHASANHSTQDKKGFLSRLLHRGSNQKPQVTQVSNSPSLRPSKFSGTVQNGTASWYGSDFHGGKTASGERYNMESMTAAHRTLPFGTVVKVRNERNGRECVVRINNRGPFIKGRILDVSKAAARQLGMVSSGVAKIKMEVLGRS